MDNVSVTDQVQTPKKNFLIPLLIVLALVAVFELALLLKKDSSLPTAVSTNTEETPQVTDKMEGATEGSMKVSAGENTNNTVGVPFTVTVIADSNGRGVVAFDAILRYDTSAFTLSSLSSTVTGFSATSNDSKGYLNITSSTNPQSTVTPVFKDTSVLTLTLVPRKAGNYTISLIDKVDSSSTKFIDNNTRIFLPSTGSVNVTVK